MNISWLETIFENNNFRFAIWDRNLIGKEINFLFELICRSLKYDSEHGTKRNFTKGEIVELKFEKNGAISRNYFRYDSVITDKSGNQKVVLYIVDGSGKTTYELLASEVLWRLNKCHNQKRKLTKRPQYIAYTNNLIENSTKIIASKINIDFEKYNSFHRTQIVYITRFPFNELSQKLKEFDYKNNSFLLYFPAFYYLESNKVKKLNPKNYERIDPERILHIFNDMGDVISFLEQNRKNNRSYLIISDSYLRMFNDLYLQDTYKDIIENVKLRVLYIGHSNDFKRMATEKNTYFENNYIKPIIINAEYQNLWKLYDRVEIVGDSDANQKVEFIYGEIRKWRDINPKYSFMLQKIIFMLLSNDEYKKPALGVLLTSLKEKYSDFQTLDTIEELKTNIERNNYKSKLENPSSKIISRNRVIEYDFIERDHMFDVFTSYPSVLKNDLFPLLSLGIINYSNIKFYLFNIESLIFKATLKTFLNNFKEYYTNASILGYQNEISEENNTDQSNVEIELLDLYNINYKAHYANQDQDNSNQVEVNEVSLGDDSNEYVMFITAKHKLMVIVDGQPTSKVLKKLKIGDKLVIIDGIRNIFSKFSNIFENSDIDIDLHDKWREALINYTDIHSFKKLAMELQNAGLKRNDLTIKNWLNNDNLIGTQKPFEDFPIIAQVTRDEEFLKVYQQSANVCSSMQRMSKKIGRLLRKLAKAKLMDNISNKNIYDGLDKHTVEELNKVIEKIKILNVIMIDQTSFKIEETKSNRLLNVDEIWQD